MRLRQKEVTAILDAMKRALPSDDCKVYLYGSRTNDAAKGGDIDLLLLCPSAVLASVKEKKRALLTAIIKEIGERKIDLTIASADPNEQSDFVKSIRPQAVQL